MNADRKESNYSTNIDGEAGDKYRAVTISQVHDVLRPALTFSKTDNLDCL